MRKHLITVRFIKCVAGRNGSCCYFWAYAFLESAGSINKMDLSSRDRPFHSSIIAGALFGSTLKIIYNYMINLIDEIIMFVLHCKIAVN